MDASEKTNNQTHESGQSLLVSEQKLDHGRRKSAFIDFSKRLLAARRSELQPGGVIVQSKAAEHYMKGKDAEEKSEYQKAVFFFTKAAFLQPEQAELHVSLGGAYIQLCDFQAAAACYKRACLLEPGAHDARLALAYNLQGQSLFDRSLFLEALQSFSRAAELQPHHTSYRTRSLFCLTAAGRHSDCLEETNRLLSESPSAELYALRAQVLKAMNQISDCVRDTKAALALDPTCRQAQALLLQLEEAGEEARQQAVLQMLSGRLQGALRSISTALQFLPEDGRLYLFRGTLFRRLKEFPSAVQDLVQAAELSRSEKKPNQEAEARQQLALTCNDSAVQRLSRGLYAEAMQLLNQGIKEEKKLAGLYLNRGDCFFQQGDWCYARLDYQQAEEMLGSDEPIVRLRLAVVHNTLGSRRFQDGRFQEAEEMFSLAVKYNPTASRYYENRSKARRRLQNQRGAREDLISMLVLDPGGEEVPPLLTALFPGSTASEVMSSPKGRAIRAELTETIRAWRPGRSAAATFLQEDLRTTKADSAGLSEAAEELKLCVTFKDLQGAFRALQQVEAALEALVPVCPVLHSGTPHAVLRPPPSSPTGSEPHEI